LQEIGRKGDQEFFLKIFKKNSLDLLTS